MTMSRTIAACIVLAGLASQPVGAKADGLMTPKQWEEYERELRDHPPDFDAMHRKFQEDAKKATQQLYDTSVRDYGERTTLECLARAGGYFNNSWLFCVLASKARN